MSPVLDLVRRLFRKKTNPDSGALVEELWLASLEGEEGGGFIEADRGDYASAYRDKGLDLELRRGRLFAWTEGPSRSLADFALEGEFSIPGGPDAPYSACGLLFRGANDSNFYSLQVSNRGFMRLDAVFNGSPRPLIAWTECGSRPEDGEPGPGPRTFTLRLIARGPHLLVFVDGQWVGEAEDGTFRAGWLAFAAQDYDEAPASFRLLALMTESRPVEVEAWYYRYNYLELPQAQARLALARTFMAMGEWLLAAVQLRKVEARQALGPEEHFLKAEIALRLELYDEAEEALEACLALGQGPAGPAGPGGLPASLAQARLEKANLLYLKGRYLELRDYAEGLLAADPRDARLLTLVGHARFNLGDYLGAAEDYGRAAGLEPDQPLFRMNEARAREQAGDRPGASRSYLLAARGFFEAEADDDLALALGRLSELDPRNPELAAFRAKLLYRQGKRKEARQAMASLIKAGTLDSAIHYLAGLLELEASRRREALPHLARALELEPTYPLYAFRHAECLYLLGSPEAPEAISRARALAPADGWTANLAAQAVLARCQARALPESQNSQAVTEDPELAEARALLEIAREALPGEAAVRVNQAALEGLAGRTEAGLGILTGLCDSGPARNEAGNLLAAAGRLEEAEKEYRAALALEPQAQEYLCNLAATLLALERYSEAEASLRKALDLEESPRALLLAGNLALVYGEWVRAEAAYRLGLETAPGDGALLLALGRTYLGARKPKKAAECLDRLKNLDVARASLLEGEILEATTESLACSGCQRTWRLPRDLPAQSGASIRAMPPDDSPAGACPRCGKIWCIACRKEGLVDNRFTCPDCGEALKLSDNRLRYLVRIHLEREA